MSLRLKQAISSNAVRLISLPVGMLLATTLVAGWLAAETRLIQAAALSAPVLKGPPNGILQRTMGPFTLYWESPAGTRQYQVKITPYNNDGPELDLSISDPAKVASQSFVVEPPEFGVRLQWMLPGMSYFWKVRVSDSASQISEEDASWSPWSETWRFVTKMPDYYRPEKPVSPRNNAILPDNTSAVFTWPSFSSTLFYYEIQVSTDSKFRTGPDAIAAVWHMLIHGGLNPPLNSWLPPPLEPGRTYYWRVRPRVQGDGTPEKWTPRSAGIEVYWSFFTPPIPAIAFWSNRGRYDYGEIYLINPDGTGLVPRIIDFSGFSGFSTTNSPDWAPDGMRIVVTSDNRYSESGDWIGIIGADGSFGGVSDNKGHDRAPDWSPDGTRIAFHLESADRPTDIYTINLIGAEQKNLTNNLPGVHARLPDWSPDGNKIAYELHDCSGGSCSHSDIYVMNADGNQVTNLTNHSTTNPRTSAYSPVWSTDGTKIAFVLNDDLFIMDSNGSNRKRLTFGEKVYNPWGYGGGKPAWSPDGTKIAYSANWEGNYEIYVMNADGSGPHVNITNHPAGDTSPSWARR